MVFFAPSFIFPISATTPSLTATSAIRRGAPVPSTTVPFLINKSYDMALDLRLTADDARHSRRLQFYRTRNFLCLSRERTSQQATGKRAGVLVVPHQHLAVDDGRHNAGRLLLEA